MAPEHPSAHSTRSLVYMNRLVTFGGCAVVSTTGEVKGAATQQRRLAILAVLARAGERGVSRSTLLSLFWPDEPDEERGRKALSQATYALRRDLGDERVIVGTHELRLDTEYLQTDVGEFAAHMRSGRFADAVALYDGPFLDGFHLVGAPAFERWAEEERRVLERDFGKALEKLANEAEQQGRREEVVQLRRKLAAVDPLDSRTTLLLMRALAANGEMTAAIRQAAIHETLIQQELELPPDREVVAYAATLREQLARGEVTAVPASAAAPAPASAPAPAPEPAPTPAPAPEPAPVSTPAPVTAPVIAPEPRHAPPSRFAFRPRVAVLIAMLLLTVAWAGWSSRDADSGAKSDTTLRAVNREGTVPNIAVGLIADFREGSAGPVRSLASLLATSLARGDGLRVVSAARLSELLYQGGTGDSTEAAYIAAARKAGAEELIDGSLYDPGDGSLRLDLRRVNVSSGEVVAAVTIRASDLFALADSGTARLLDGLGVPPLQGSVREVTTSSASALRFFAEGVRASAAYDVEGARRLFGEAIREDSLFAMAMYEYARANPNRAELAEEMERALRLSRRATVRERLIIQAGWASIMQLPGLTETADSLLDINPNDPQALLFAAEGRLNTGDPEGAHPLLLRAIANDSLALRAERGPNCYACEAVLLQMRAFLDQNDPDAAVRAGKKWVDVQPLSADAWGAYSRVLDFTGRLSEGERALQRALALNPAYPSGFVRRISNLLRGARFAEAEQLAREQTTLATADQRLDGWWQLTTILRHQGRMREALQTAMRFRALRDTVDGGRMALNHAYVPALVLHDAGQTRASIAVFDSMASGAIRPGEHQANVRRLRTISLTAAADLLAQLGDTASLSVRLRDIEAAGRESGVARDTRAHHYVRGLLYRARGQTDQAISAWRAAVAPPLRGYHSRINLELAHALLAKNEPEEAIRVIQPIMRDVVDGIAVTHTEMHELLALAHAAAGRRDSAMVHRDWVTRAWSKGEPAFRTRAQRLAERVR